jgi:hypothetical protein
MAEPEDYGVEILRILEEHHEDHPQGFNETELMQYNPELRLLKVRSSMAELEAAGKVQRVTADVGQMRVALLDAELEDVQIGHVGPGAAPADLPGGAERGTNDVRESAQPTDAPESTGL